MRITSILKKPPVLLFSLLGPVTIYVGLILHYGVNFPFLDDYDTILTHLLYSPTDQIRNWFAPHNEHIHLILRLLASLDTWIFGQVQLVRLMVVGIVFYLGLYLFLLKTMRRWETPWIWLVPLPFLLFQPSYWGSMTWATTALHNFPGLLFAFLSINFWITESPQGKVCGLLFLLLALLTNGFGLAALAALILRESLGVIGIHKSESSRTWTTNTSWMTLLILVLVIWIIFMPSHAGSEVSSAFSVTDPLSILHFFCNFIGSCIHFLGVPGIILLAIIQLGLFAWLNYQGLARKSPLLYWFIVYLLLCAILVTLARADMGPKQGLASRYRIISTLLLGSQYLAMANLYWNKWDKKSWILPTTLGLAVLFYCSSLMANLNNLGKIQNRLMEDQARWSTGVSLQEYPYPDRAASILKNVQRQGVFNPEGPNEPE